MDVQKPLIPNQSKQYVVKHINTYKKLFYVSKTPNQQRKHLTKLTNIVPGSNQQGHCAQHRSQQTDQLTEKDNIFFGPLDEFMLMTPLWQEMTAEKF